MTLDEFELMIARYGATLAAWPEGERHAGEALLARSGAARELLAHQATLDQLFATAPEITAPPGLKARVLAAAATPVARAPSRGMFLSRLRGNFGGFWPQMVGFAAASVLGFMVGMTDLGFVPGDQSSDFSAYIVGYGDETSLAAIIGEP